ncbi:MarR family transcriptional regulator [Salana multivorans]|uniref:MarR family transcriptional regulator n=1 Tax=Salana multivorans TaxID=120377 RepID=A0A3N2D0J0_9MICO|nr:MarR family transcriptional regulator [Salana multivorans]ROR93168.1 MarR family transcriptional regulator [Salana multivorans]
MSRSAKEALTRRSLYDVDVTDPTGLLVDRTGMTPEDVAQITRLMSAIAGMREAEERLSEASTRYMKLNRTDMRALHFLIASQNRGSLPTPGAIAQHLGISTASTTKLLDRLERAGHIRRETHPSDRRALLVRITPETHRAAMATVGRQQARRFGAAARLTHDEREVVIRFLEDATRSLSLTDVPWAQGTSGESDAGEHSSPRAD